MAPYPPYAHCPSVSEDSRDRSGWHKPKPYQEKAQNEQHCVESCLARPAACVHSRHAPELPPVPSLPRPSPVGSVLLGLYDRQQRAITGSTLPLRRSSYIHAEPCDGWETERDPCAEERTSDADDAHETRHDFRKDRSTRPQNGGNGYPAASRAPAVLKRDVSLLSPGPEPAIGVFDDHHARKNAGDDNGRERANPGGFREYSGG